MLRPYLKHLRVACTVVCLVACVLTLALWKRSYQWVDSLTFRAHPGLAVQSIDGQLRFAKPVLASSRRMSLSRERPENVRERSVEMPWVWLFKWPFMSDNNRLWPVIPHWFIASVFAMLAAAPWLRRRYSLQTLLLAMTIAAVVLAAIVLSR